MEFVLLPNKYNNCILTLSDKDKDAIIEYYLKPNSQQATAIRFNISLHSLKNLISSRNVVREKYSKERNELVSRGIKETLNRNPSIVQARTIANTGAKRSDESKKRMQEAAWKRMERQKDRFVSAAENKFAEFLRNKLGLTVQQQYRAGLKPFDYLVDNKVLVEFDGPHHYDPNYYMCKCGKVNFEKQQERDNKRKDIAASLNMPLVVVQQKELNKKMELKGDAMHKFMFNLGYEVI